MSASSPSSRVWVLPNRHTFGLVAVLLAMWYAGASQSNTAAYLLAFVLAGVALISAVHAWANLRGVVITADPIAPVFTGEEMGVFLRATSDRNRKHGGVFVTGPGATEPAVFGEVGASAGPQVRLGLPADRRGCFTTLRLRTGSLFPLGFFTAWRVIHLTQPHWVYPRPEGARPLPRTHAPVIQASGGQRMEGDDYGGVRAWQPGESQRHIDWKAAARGQPMLIKQWTGETDELLDLDWQQIAPLDDEARLSQLARWIVQAERGGLSYGLRLPGVMLAPACGEAHYHACLRALAVYGTREESPP